MSSAGLISMKWTMSQQMTLLLTLTTWLSNNPADVDEDDGNDLNLSNDEGNQKILANVTQCNVLPPSDIHHWVLATQQTQQEQKIMQKNPSKAKKTITINGVIYTANVYNIVYSISKHHADKQETSLVDCQCQYGR